MCALVTGHTIVQDSGVGIAEADWPWRFGQLFASDTDHPGTPVVGRRGKFGLGIKAVILYGQ